MLDKHTPGPWLVRHVAGGAPCLVDANGAPGSPAVASTNVAGAQSLPLEDRQANARLIAASPELLELAKRFEATFGPEYDRDDPVSGADCVDLVMAMVDDFRTVLARIEGS